jgi:hypothetical protein
MYFPSHKDATLPFHQLSPLFTFVSLPTVIAKLHLQIFQNLARYDNPLFARFDPLSKTFPPSLSHPLFEYYFVC